MAVIRPARSLPKAGLQAGDRAPDAQYIDAHGHTRRVHEAFQGPHFTLLALGAGAGDAAAAVAWPAAGAALERLVAPDPGPGLTRIYGVTGTALVLVRPDGYIAAIDRDGQHAAIKQFLTLATP